MNNASIGVNTAVFSARQRSLKVFETIRGLLEQRLYICRDCLISVSNGPAASKTGLSGQPLFKVIIETVLGLSGLQREKAKYERSGETEKG